MVRAHSGEVTISPHHGRPSTLDTVVRPDVPKGAWVSYRPGQTPVLDDGAPDWYRDVVIQPVVSASTGELIGHASFEPAQYAEDFEANDRHLDEATTFVHYNRALNAVTREHVLPRPGPEAHPLPEDKAYRLTSHGIPGYLLLVVRDRATGKLRTRHVGEDEAVRWAIWMTSRLPKDHWIDLPCCWVGSPENRAVPNPNTASEALPGVFVPDPLDEVALGQRIANGTRRWARASEGPQGMDTVGGKYVRVLTADAQGRYRAWVLFRPEPQGVELDVLARVAGLHSGGGEASAEVRVRTLRLVRALKSMFDVWVEDRADFGDLLRGVAAVDEMWRADPEFEQAGPLTLDLLTRVVAAQAEPWVGVDQET
ncbi:lonely Cys domain-containing protein, partial [Streptomyces sp. 2MCAF27]